MGLQGGRITVTGYKFLDGIWHLGLEVLVDKNIKVNRNSSTKLSKIMDFSEAFEPTMSVDALHTSDMDGIFGNGRGSMGRGSMGRGSMVRGVMAVARWAVAI